MKAQRNAPRAVAAALSVAALSTAASAAALPHVGAPRPNVVLVDAWDRQLQLGSLDGTPTLVVYEDQGSSKVNDGLKRELSRLARGGAYRSQIAVVAVADVSGYDYWPVRGFVKDAIRDESRKQGIPIYCDWSADFRRTLSLNRHASNVVLYGRDGTVLYARAGRLTDAEQRELLTLLRQQLRSG